MFFDPWYFVVIAPALLLAFWAQHRVRSTYAAAAKVPSSLTGAAAARLILDSAGLRRVEIEAIPGELSDHYDPRDKVLRLSQNVFYGRSMAAVGIAAHEAGHALQDARAYAPLVIRNAAVGAAQFGSGISMFAILAGAVLTSAGTFLGPILIWVGIAGFSAMVFFQLVNLPVEFNASSRAKQQLMSLGIVHPQEMEYVNRVLGAAALTYVAATLQSVLTLLYLVLRFGSRSSDR
jgi:Zn-dependent membrane protease YugP